MATSSSQSHDGDAKEDEKPKRRNISMPPDKFEEEITPFVEQHFEGNLSLATRVCILSEKERREEGVDVVEMRIMKNQLNDVIEGMNHVTGILEKIVEENESIALLMDDESRISKSSIHREHRPAKLDVTTKVADSIREAENPMTTGNILAKVDLELPTLHQSLEKLLNEGVIEPMEEENGYFKYQSATAEVGE